MRSTLYMMCVTSRQRPSGELCHRLDRQEQPPPTPCTDAEAVAEGLRISDLLQTLSQHDPSVTRYKALRSTIKMLNATNKSRDRKAEYLARRPFLRYHIAQTSSSRSYISKGLSHMPTLTWAGKEDALRAASLVPFRLRSSHHVADDIMNRESKSSILSTWLSNPASFCLRSATQHSSWWW